MRRQKKNQAGITLIALVISIIVMLILAGVSLNATVGENGILTQAQEASKQHKIATELENLNLEFTKLNINTISEDQVATIQEIVNELIEKGLIDKAVTTSAGQIAVGMDTATGNRYFYGIKGDNTYKIVRGKDNLLIAELSQNASGGDITGGSALVTEDSFNSDSSLPEEEKGKFTITANSDLAFMDTISGELCVYVKSGVHATVGIYANMTLTNESVARSAIDVEPGGILDLYIEEGVEVIVNSGFGTDPERAVGQPGRPGEGGYAGIHIPWIDQNKDNVRDIGEYAILNLSGEGKIIAYGGNAGDGSDAAQGDIGGSGGGGAGAGIGGHGGKGGIGNSTSAKDGENGENCGEINIYNKVIIYAYGGGGGSSGTLNKENAEQTGSGTGGGGYPGAGIGGGGAGGGGAQHTVGAGGYSSGSCEADTKGITNYNGLTNGYTEKNKTYFGSGAYFLGSDNKIVTGDANCDKTMECRGGHIGGEGAVCLYHSYQNCTSGNGGYAGRGGIVNVNYTTNENKASVNAFNGNKYTDGKEEHKYNNGDNQCPIYIQSGNPLDAYIVNNNYTSKRFAEIEYALGVDTSSWTKAISYATCKDYVVKLENRTVSYSACEKYINPKSGDHQGVGSGAGYIEVSNGTYTLCNEVNGKLIPISN